MLSIQSKCLYVCIYQYMQTNTYDMLNPQHAHANSHTYARS